MAKVKDTIKGIIFGVLSFAFLEWGTIWILGYYKFDHNFDLTFHPGDYKFITPLICVFIVTALFGVATVKQFQLLKKITLGIIIVLILLVIGFLAYCIWYRVNIPPTPPRVLD